MDNGLSKIFAQVASENAEQILRNDFLNAIKQAYKFASGSTQKEYGLVYHKLKEQGTATLYRKAWDYYYSDIESWLRIPVMEASYLKNLDDVEGRGFVKKGKTLTIEKPQDRIQEVSLKDVDLEEQRSSTTTQEDLYYFLSNASNKPEFLIRDMGSRIIDPHFYLGKLWHVTRRGSDFILNEVP